MLLSLSSGLSREERPERTKIGTGVAHVTRNSDTTLKVKMSKVNLLLMHVLTCQNRCNLANKCEDIVKVQGHGHAHSLLIVDHKKKLKNSDHIQS